MRLKPVIRYFVFLGLPYSNAGRLSPILVYYQLSLNHLTARRNDRAG